MSDFLRKNRLKLCHRNFTILFTQKFTRSKEIRHLMLTLGAISRNTLLLVCNLYESSPQGNLLGDPPRSLPACASSGVSCLRCKGLCMVEAQQLIQSSDLHTASSALGDPSLSLECEMGTTLRAKGALILVSPDLLRPATCDFPSHNTGKIAIFRGLQSGHFACIAWENRMSQRVGNRGSLILGHLRPSG